MFNYSKTVFFISFLLHFNVFSIKNQNNEDSSSTQSISSESSSPELLDTKDSFQNPIELAEEYYNAAEESILRKDFYSGFQDYLLAAELWRKNESLDLAHLAYSKAAASAGKMGKLSTSHLNAAKYYLCAGNIIFYAIKSIKEHLTEFQSQAMLNAYNLAGYNFYQNGLFEEEQHNLTLALQSYQQSIFCFNQCKNINENEIEYLNKIDQCYEKFATIYYQLGAIYEKEKNYKNATEYFLQSSSYYTLLEKPIYTWHCENVALILRAPLRPVPEPVLKLSKRAHRKLEKKIAELDR